jgi:hypothetical protein
MTGAPPLIETRLLDLASLMFVMIGSLPSSFAMLSGGLSHSPGAKLPINNDAPWLLRHQDPSPVPMFAALGSSAAEIFKDRAANNSKWSSKRPDCYSTSSSTGRSPHRNATAFATPLALEPTPKLWQSAYMPGSWTACCAIPGVAITAHRIAATARSLNLVIVDFLHAVVRMRTI